MLSGARPLLANDSSEVLSLFLPPKLLCGMPVLQYPPSYATAARMLLMH